MQKSLSHQKLIISLIKDNLINTKLLNGFHALGINADNYTQHLSETIFELMGLGSDEKSDEIFEYYLRLLNGVNKINISEQPERLRELADTIHWKLAIKKYRDYPSEE